MESKSKDEYLSDLKLILERVREASKAANVLGDDCEEFVKGFFSISVGFLTEMKEEVQ